MKMQKLPRALLGRRSGPVTLLVLIAIACGTFTGFPNQHEVCDFNAQRELERAASAADFPEPQINAVFRDGNLIWQPGMPAPAIAPGELIHLVGTGFGNGPDLDFSKIMIGNSRVLETDLRMFRQELDITKEVHFETDEVKDTWDSDIVLWQDDEIIFNVPIHVSKGPITVQVQKRIGYNESLVHPGEPHNVIDAQTKRIDLQYNFNYECDVVSKLTEPKGSNSVPVDVANPNFGNLAKLGQEIFWGYDFNLGLAHKFRGLDWNAIFAYDATDPVTGQVADPKLLFGAVPMVNNQVPSAAYTDVYFDPYPMLSPIPGFLGTGPQKYSGNTRSSGWVGYRYAESVHPFEGDGEWIGFNCASCHGYQITYEKSPGNTITKVFPGPPNPTWTMKWAVLDGAGDFEGISGKEEGPVWAPGKKAIDKTQLIYVNPQGAGEHTMVRFNGEGSETDNDYEFSPIVIPNVTNHLPIRRSLSHTESYVGFEGSYIHSEEPDGATGSMTAHELQALTAYMTTLDKDDDDLRNVGLYRWLVHKGQLAAQAGNVSEGQFVQNGWESYPGVANRVAAGKDIFDESCSSCHGDKLGIHTNEEMYRIDEVGRFFAPTIYQKEQEGMAVEWLRNLYWVQHRGLLSDGHVRNLEDLVDPARCTEGSDLYNQYYTLHAPANPALGGPDHPAPFPAWNRKGDVFRVKKSDPGWFGLGVGAKYNRFIERHKYFVEVPWDDDYYYWDYQKMRAEYGPDEMGTPGPIGMPAAPHPWCASSQGDISDLVEYLLTL